MTKLKVTLFLIKMILVFKWLPQAPCQHFVCKLVTRPLTVGTTVMKNWEPLVPAPAFAMLSVYGRSCLSVVWNSSSNSPPQMLSPPMPVPVGSPVWIMKLCTRGQIQAQLFVALVTD